MQLVRADEVLGPLRDRAPRRRRDELGRHRRLEDRAQHLRARPRSRRARPPTRRAAARASSARSRSRCTSRCGRRRRCAKPRASSERSPVPTTMPALLVREVHQDLRPLAGLQVLEGDARVGRRGRGRCPRCAARRPARMSISRSSLPQRAARGARAVSSVRALVPKPGMVTASTSPRGRPSRSSVRAQTSRASVESRPPERPSTSRREPVCSSRRARPAVWIENTSRQRSSTRRGVGGHERVRLERPRSSRAGRRAGIGVERHRAVARAGRVHARRRSVVCRARSTRSRSMSTSATIRSPSRRKRSPSASKLPFSAISKWPPNTRSVVDSWTPAFA